MNRADASYLRALRYDWLTPLYDFLIRWSIRESAFKQHLVEQAGIERGHRVLDLGCGTATLTILVKQAYPQARIVGLDADPRILEIAQRKIVRAGLGVALNQGMACDLPYPNGSFDRVLSSLFFHHLKHEQKKRTLKEVFRVLRPGGELHVADWGKPSNALMRGAFLLVQLLDGFETTADHVTGLLPELFRAVGFEEVRETACFTTMFGTLALFRSAKFQ